MHKIEIDMDSQNLDHPPRLVVKENGVTLLDMPGDEFLAWVQAVIAARSNRPGSLPKGVGVSGQ